MRKRSYITRRREYVFVGIKDLSVSGLYMEMVNYLIGYVSIGLASIYMSLVTPVKETRS